MHDPYSKAIIYVSEFYNITREECVENYWDEVESMMTILPILTDRDNDFDPDD